PAPAQVVLIHPRQRHLRSTASPCGPTRTCMARGSGPPRRISWCATLLNAPGLVAASRDSPRFRSTRCNKATPGTIVICTPRRCPRSTIRIGLPASRIRARIASPPRKHRLLEVGDAGGAPGEQLAELIDHRRGRRVDAVAADVYAHDAAVALRNGDEV